MIKHVPELSSCKGIDFLNISSQCNKVFNTAYSPLIVALNVGSLKCVKLLIKVWCIHLISLTSFELLISII